MKPLNKIMILDDDEVNNFIFSQLIKLTGASKEIISFAKGHDAMNYIKQNEQQPEKLPEIIFVDLFLFDMTGWEFIEWFETLAPVIRSKMKMAILTTSIFEEDEKKSAGYSSVNYFLTKPITVEKLMEIYQDVKKKRDNQSQSFLMNICLN